MICNLALEGMKRDERLHWRHNQRKKRSDFKSIECSPLVCRVKKQKDIREQCILLKIALIRVKFLRLNMAISLIVLSWKWMFVTSVVKETERHIKATRSAEVCTDNN